MRVIAFDTETKGLDWFDPDQQAFLATWADEQGEYCADLSDEAQVAQFRAALDAADTVVCHNMSFDGHQVRATLGFDPLAGKQLHDTDLMSRVMYPEGQRKGERGGHGLKNLAKVYLRADAGDTEEAIKEMAKAIGLKTIKQTGAYFDVWRAYPDVMEEYARMDARFTYDLFTKFEPLSITDADVKRVYDLEMAVLPILMRAEERGTRTDQEACAQLKRQYSADLDKVDEYLTEEIGEQALSGEGSEDALIEALLKIGVPLTEKTSTGKLATNKFALQPFAKDFPQIDALFEHRRLERFLTTYIGAIEGREIVHPSFRQCGAWTGRMSCTRPNMQNWPQRAGKEVRAVLIPREGHSFVVCDYDTIEIRLLAYYLNDDGFSQMIEDGHDAHAWMAANIWGGDPHDWRKDGPKAEGDKQSRKTARHTLFAICYGAGARRVAGMNDMSIDEAKALISKIKASLPNYFRLNKRIRTKIETLGYVNTLFGRKNPVSKDKSYVGLNALIQGSAADIMKQGLINVDQAVRPLGGIPLLVVHDEVVVEVPSENADEALRLTEQALISAADISPGLAVSGSVVTTSYADA